MVAIVSGNGTGLLNSSASVLGQGIFGNASTGNAKESVYINAANGNLTLQDKDDYLAATGISLALTRTYNSQGSFNDGAGAQWKLGVRKQLSGLPAVPGSAGSTLVRTDGDGSIQRYTWDASRNAYFSTDGGGSYQTIVRKSDGTWEWHAGHVDDKGLYEVYDSTGRLTKVADEVGVRLSYGYNASTGKLETITDASADTTTFKFDAAGNLKEIATTLPDKTVSSRVVYDYDAQNRLKTVTTDLTPGVKTDALTYVTTYTYVGATNYIQNVTQSDGTSLTFGYETATGGRVTSVTDALNRTTKFDYSVAGQTTVTDPQKFTTVYQYDGAGQLTRITDANGQSASFIYDTQGNVKSATDARGQATSYEYDANGNCTLQRDSIGNVIKRAYNLANNTLASQSTYREVSGVPTPALTTSFLYDDKNRLRFTVSPEGRVTESRYNTEGQRAALIAYTAKQYTGAYTTAALQAWLTNTASTYGDLSRSTRTDFIYDARGLVKTATTYAVLGANGEGTASPANTVVQYTYDQAGQLLTSADGNNNQTVYTYDGLGRMLTTRDAKGNVTVTTYDDAANTIKVTLAGGLARTSTFDKAGQLLAITEAPKDAAAGAGVLGKTSYTYDDSGRLRMVQDALGVRSFLFYDDAGRKTAEVDGDGSVTEFLYNANGQVSRTKRYPSNINSAALLLDASGKLLTNKTLNDIRPNAAAGTIRSVWNTYDDVGRLVDTVVALDTSRAAVTRRYYDDQSRLVKETEFFTEYDAKLLAGNDRPAPLSGLATSTSDRNTLYIYDKDGLLAGVIDGEGYLTEHRYSAAGQRIETLRWPVARTQAQLAATTMAGVRPENPDAANAVVQRTRFIYDAKGRQVGAVDSAGYLTETVYDKAGNITATIRYATPVAYSKTYPDGYTLDNLRPTAAQQQAAPPQTVRYTYTALNQVDTTTGLDGVMTTYGYDNMGRVASTTVSTPGATPTAAAIVVAKPQYRYDLQGRVTQSLPASATAELVKAGAVQAAIDKVWADYADKYTYDANGNRTTVTDALGNRSVYFYDEDGRLRYSINAAGEVSARTYTAFGQPLTATRYAARLSAADLAALQGGLLTSAVNTKLTALANGAETVQSWEYDLAGQQTLSKDALGYYAGATYNAFGEVILRTDGNAGVTADRARNPSLRTVYDANGRVIATVNGTGEVTGVSYDASGKITRRVTFAIGTAQLNRDISVADIKALLAAGASNPAVRNGAEQRYFYNSRDQLVTTMTAQGNTNGVRDWSVVTQTYDSFGNPETRRAYAKTISADEPLATAALTESASDAITVNWYDNANRPALQASAAGLDDKGQRLWSVVGNTYNAAGQLAVRTAYATQFATLPNKLPARTDVPAPAANDGNAVTCYAYDSAGRVSATAVYQGKLGAALQWAVSAVTYDKAGNVASRTDYANPAVGQNTNPTAAQAAALLAAMPAADAMDDRVMRYGYDAAGRNYVTVDGNGSVTSQVFDAKGNVIQRTAHATLYTTAGLLPAGFKPTADALADRSTVYVYDKDNRPVYDIDAGGAVTKRDYDGSGRVIAVTRHLNVLASGVIAPGATVEDVRAKLADNPNDRITRYTFDQAGRLRFTIDVAGHVTESSYDALGNMVKSTEYADTYNVAGNASPESVADTMAKLMAASKSVARSTTYAYDAVGRVTSSTNLQLNKPESWTYDALGNRLTYTNVMGQTWNYAYDAGGRMVQETSPQVDVLQASTAFAVAGTPGQIRTRITYNTFGEVWKRTEGIVVRGNVEDAASARTTTYEYDAAGRQVKVIYPSTGVYNRAETGLAKTPATGDAARAEKALAATVVTTYDALGNAISNTDADGNVSYKAYDRMGQVAYDKDALGFVTGYARDAFGAVTQLTRYNASVSLSAADSSNAAVLKTKVNAKDPLNRTVTTTYDKVGRVIMVREPAATIYDAHSLSANTTPVAARTTRNDYNAFGDLYLVSVYGGDDNGKALTQAQKTYTYYDKAGRRSGQFVLVRADGAREFGYVTKYELDAYGNVEKETEFATEAELRADARTAQAPDQPQASANDRATKYVYDSLNRKESVTRLNVTYMQNGQSVTAPLKTSFGYDALGNLVSTTDPAGNVTYSYYDVLGRVRATASVQDPKSKSKTGDPAPLTVFERDAYGNVVRQTAYANGAGTADDKTYSVKQADAAKDRVTVNRYDVNSRLVASRNAEGKDSFSSYDASGRIAKQWRTVTTSANTQYSVVEITTYDAVGRVVGVATADATTIDANSGAGTSLATKGVKYNAFGEIVLKFLNAEANAYATIEYDNAGRVWRSDDGDGVTRIMQYDGVGNETVRTVSSETGDPLAQKLTVDQLLALGSLQRTYTRYDLMGHVVDVATPMASSNSTPAQIALDLYNVLLNRFPTQQELQEVVPRIANGASAGVIANEILATAEAKTRLSGNALSVIDLIMREAFGRVKGDPQYTADNARWAAGLGDTPALREQRGGDAIAAMIADVRSGRDNSATMVASLQHLNDRYDTGKAYLIDYIGNDVTVAKTLFTQSATKSMAVEAAKYSSDQQRRTDVAQIYIAILRRLPEPTGFEWWMDKLNNNLITLEDLANGVIGSSEAIGLGVTALSDSDFVKSVYNSMFARAPGSDELQSWTAKMARPVDRVSRAQFVLQLIAQANADLPGSSIVQADIDVLGARVSLGMAYLALPNRTDTPDAIRAVVASVQRGATGQAAMDQALASLAAAAKAAADNVANAGVAGAVLPLEEARLQVSRLYVILLGRPPEASGLDHWSAMLMKGVAFADVARDIANSPEAAPRYPASLDNTQFFNTLMTTAFGRAPQKEESDAIATLPAGSHRGNVVQKALDGILAYTGKDTARLSTQALLNNRAAVAELFAVNLGGSDEAIGKQIISLVKDTGITDALAYAQSRLQNLFDASANAAALAAAQATTLMRDAATAAQVFADVAKAAPGTAMGKNISAVAQLYVAVLGRAHPGMQAIDLGGLAFFADALSTNATTLEKIVQGMLDSTEGKGLYPQSPPAAVSPEALVNRIYDQVLGPIADPAGKAEWTAKVAAVALTGRGAVVYKLINTLLSRSLADGNATNAAELAGRRGFAMRVEAALRVVDISATNAIQQAIDTKNLSDSAAPLAAATASANAARDAYSTTILGATSASNASITPTKVGVTVANLIDIARLYSVVLGREATSAELAWWLNARPSDTLVGMTQKFIDSDEARLKLAAMSNTAYIDYLYRNMIGRPLAAGDTFWSDQLAKPGATRADVTMRLIAGFSTQSLASSAEYEYRRAYDQRIYNMLTKLSPQVPTTGTAVTAIDTATKTSVTADAALKSSQDAFNTAAAAIKADQNPAVKDAQNLAASADKVLLAAQQSSAIPNTKLLNAVLGLWTALGFTNWNLTQLATTVSDIAAGRSTLAALAQAQVPLQALTTPEARRAFVLEMYGSILRRAPLQNEVQWWVDNTRNWNQGDFIVNFYMGATNELTSVPTAARKSFTAELNIQFKRATDEATAAKNAVATTAAASEARVNALKADPAAGLAAAQSVAATANAAYQKNIAAMSAASNLATSKYQAARDAYNIFQAKWMDYYAAVTTDAANDPAVQALKPAADSIKASQKLPNFDMIVEMLVVFRAATPDNINRYLVDFNAGRITLDNLRFALAGPTTDRLQFVKNLYSNLLGRPGEAAGIAYWYDIATRPNADLVGVVRDFYNGAVIELKGPSAKRDISAEKDAATTGKIQAYDNALAAANNALSARRNPASYASAYAAYGAALSAFETQSQIAGKLSEIVYENAKASVAADAAVKDAESLQNAGTQLASAKSTANAARGAMLQSLYGAAALLEQLAATADSAASKSIGLEQQLKDAIEALKTKLGLTTLNNTVAELTKAVDRARLLDTQVSEAVAVAELGSKQAGGVADYYNKLLALDAGSAQARADVQVAQVYVMLLGRAPTAAELADALAVLRTPAGMTGLVTNIMAANPVLYPASQSNDAFVTSLYKQGLGRDTANDKAGMTFWSSQLAGANAISRAQLVLNLTDSVARRVFNNDTSTFDSKVATALAAVSAELAKASSGTKEAWLELNASASRKAEVAAAAAATAKLEANAGAKNLLQITRLYVGILGRAPEGAGLAFWANIAASGISITDVAQYILMAPEAELRFSPASSNAQFIQDAFVKALGRQPTVAESTRFLADLGNPVEADRKTRGAVMLAILNEAADYSGPDMASAVARTLLNNKVEVALRAITSDADGYAKTMDEASKIAAAIAATKPNFRYGGSAANMASNVSNFNTADKYKVDRWGNVVSVTDVRNPAWITTYEYDANNMQVKQTAPSDTSGGEAGPVVISNGYDMLGRLVFSRDARGNTSSQEYNVNGYLTKETHADGGVVTYEVDVFGQRLKSVQYLGNDVYASSGSVVTSFDYDRMGRMTKTTSAVVDVWTAYDQLHTTGVWGALGSTDMQVSVYRAAQVTSYGYDELGRRITTTSAASGTSTPATLSSKVLYDAAGNMARNTSPFIAGNDAITYYKYDNFGRQTSVIDAMGGERKWEIDTLTGRVKAYTDLQGIRTDYTYTASGMLSTAKSTLESVAYTYDRVTGGLVQVIRTAGLEETTATYGYDLAGNRTIEKTVLETRNSAQAVLSRQVLQNQINEYDQANRLKGITASDIKGASYVVQYTFDRNGNRLTQSTQFTTDSGDVKNVKVTNTYDKMNRLATNSSIVSTTRHRVINANTRKQQEMAMDDPEVIDYDKEVASHAIKYNAMGNRVSDITGGVEETYNYDDLGRLTSTFRGGQLVGNRSYDAAGRVVMQLDNGENRVNAYDAAGHLLRQRVSDVKGGGNTFKYDVDYVHYADAQNKIWNKFAIGYDELGNSNFYAVYTNKEVETSRTTWTNITFGKHGDAWREESTQVGAPKNNYAETKKTYAGNNLVQIDSGKKSVYNALLVPSEITKVLYTVDNQILEKRGGTYVNGVAKLATNNATHVLLANGELIGSSDNVNESFSDMVASIGSQSDGGTLYTVQSGDTLRSIAKAVWGDDNLWYLITGADSNADGKLVVGQSIMLPPRINAVNNDYNSFKPYRPGEIIGDTTPQLAPPSNKGGCGGIGQIVMIVVAVVATIYTAGAMSGVAGGFLNTMAAGASALGGGVTVAGVTASAAGFVGGAIAGAVGSIASQAVGMAIGAQDKFSWKGVALSAIGSGVSSGVSAWGASSGGFGFDFNPLGGKDWTAVASRAMLSNTISQGVGMITGLQKGFSWRSVAAAGAGAVVGNTVTEKLNGSELFKGMFDNDVMRGIAAGTLSGMAAGVTATVMRGGKVAVQQIATDAFGNALANSVVDALTPKEQVSGGGATHHASSMEGSSAAITSEGVATHTISNMREYGNLTPEQGARLDDLEQAIASGDRSLSFVTGSNEELSMRDGAIANAKYLYGTDRVLVSAAVASAASSTESNATRLAVMYEETSEWIAHNIGLTLDNGLGGRADVGAAFGRIAFSQLLSAQGIDSGGNIAFNMTIDDVSGRYNTNAESVDVVGRGIFRDERILAGYEDTSGAFQGGLYPNGTDPNWHRPLTANQQERFIEAICKARTPGITDFSRTSIEVVASAIGGDFTEETVVNQNRYTTRQAAFNSFFMKSGSDWYGYTPWDNQLYPEVTYRRSALGEFTEPVLSNGRYDDYGNLMPGSIQRGLAVGREDGRGNTVRFDLTVKDNPALPLTWSNVKALYEIKFAGDGLTNNQTMALRQRAVADKAMMVYAEDFARDCEYREIERQNATNRAASRTIDTVFKLFWGTRGGPRGGFNPGRP